MKTNKFMLISGLLLVIGSTVLFPLLGVGGAFLFGEELDKILNSNKDALQMPAAVFIAVMIIIPITGAFLIFGSVLIPLFSGMRAKNKILSQGQPAEAKILALADTGTRINRNPLVKFTLEVHPSLQPPFRAEVSQTVSVIHLPSFQPGKIVQVKYLPGTNDVAIIGTN